MSATAAPIPDNTVVNDDVPTSMSASIMLENLPMSAATALQKYKTPNTSKIVLRFRAVGNAPILKQSFFKITASNKFQAVIQFLRKELNFKPSDSLFLYINSAFAPSPDEIVGNLHKCFNTDGHLIVNYCTTAAWG